MKKLIISLLGAITLTTLSSCVVTPARSHTVIVSPDYPSPGPGWEWQEHPKYGWGWYSHDRGWHKGWYKNKGRGKH